MKISLAHFILAAGSGVTLISMFRVSNRQLEIYKSRGLNHSSMMNTKAQCGQFIIQALGIEIHAHVHV